ncbi:MAG: rhomboid family intramembrane serine protease [Chitinophagales bacterium]|nr:rhomboid family intramembrane serine protease [Chitinophagales bacterium]MDW8418452.1 rhomboid family intramembrane serine protease [Chitinophagales bacterium]
MLTGSLRGDIEHQLRYGSTTVKIIWVNVAVFLAVSLLRVVAFFTGWEAPVNFVLRECMAPASFSDAIRHPWSLIIYSFFHINIFHILFNMLWLYWFAGILVTYHTERRILPLYLCGALLGWALFAMAVNFIPVLRPGGKAALLGASAGIMAVVWAAVTFNPSHTVNLLFIGRLKVIYVALIAMLIDFLAVADGKAGTWFAHLGGALMGWMYVRLLRTGVDLFRPLQWIGQKNVAKASMCVNKQQPRKHAAQKRSADEQKRLDEILDKISASGYESLTREEKEFLFRYSQRL